MFPNLTELKTLVLAAAEDLKAGRLTDFVTKASQIADRTAAGLRRASDLLNNFFGPIPMTFSAPVSLEECDALENACTDLAGCPVPVADAGTANPPTQEGVATLVGFITVLIRIVRLLKKG